MTAKRKPELNTALLYVLLAALLAAMPITDEPHLIGKLKLLKNGYLTQLMDWFDLAFHGLPLPAALLYLCYRFATRNEASKKS